MLLFTNARGVSVKCINRGCRFKYSSHYEYGKKSCNQTLDFKEVRTEHLCFTIIKNDKKSEVYKKKLIKIIKLLFLKNFTYGFI